MQICKKTVYPNLMTIRADLVSTVGIHSDLVSIQSDLVSRSTSMYVHLDLVSTIQSGMVCM